jgi:hypothetical protein
MYIGDDQYGLNSVYNAEAVTDGFRNITAISSEYANCSVPLPVDLNIGDTVKICGIAYLNSASAIIDPYFYITVSHFSCADVNFANSSDVSTYTVIPVATYPIDTNINVVCFSEEVVLTEILPGCSTLFVVGFNFTDANEEGSNKKCRISYTLSATQACIAGGNNLLIRNCCDPAYTEVIIDNGTAVGASFVDNELNCWTVVSLTTNNVTGIRTKVTGYTSCETCLSANPCPENLVVDSCCAAASQFFSGALPGVNVGDTFVDTNGYCWSVTGTTPLPITNVVTVGTSYPATDCNDETCITSNACPTPVMLESCCKLGDGFTTLEALQAVLPSLDLYDTFVDTFGFCWKIFPTDPAFPNLSFITPVTDYNDSKCSEPGGCLESNPCPETLYYTVQNCCTEEIETVLIDSGYNVGRVLTIVHTTGAGCYRIISWSDTGTTTLTIVDIPATAKDCEECIQQVFKGYCQGVSQCCNEYQNVGEDNATMTGYKCDGTWIVDYSMAPSETICMAFVYSTTGDINFNGCCEFNVYNPSSTTDLYFKASACEGEPTAYILPPLTNILAEHGTCVGCVYAGTSGPWEYAPCLECLYYSYEGTGSAGTITYNDCEGFFQEIFFDPYETGNFCASNTPSGTGGVLINILPTSCP